MEVLLTGATGYVGSRVEAVLRASGISCIRLAGRLEEIQPGTLVCDAVIHCAGALRNRPGMEFRSNAEGTVSLIRGLSRSTRVVMVSTRSVYARSGHRRVTEEEATKPFDDYGTSKRLAEQALLGSGHPVVVLRSSGIFGHPDRSGIFPDHALDRMLSGEPVNVADPDRCEDYVDVEWLAGRVVNAALGGGADGRVLHVAGPARSLEGMLGTAARLVEEMTGRTVTLRRRPMALPDYPWLDASLLGRILGPCPHPADEEVFRRMIGARLRRGAERPG